MRTFSVQTLGCRVNQYESEQLAAVLRGRGLIEVAAPDGDVRVINTCSVTVPAAKKSRQLTRQATGIKGAALPVLQASGAESIDPDLSARPGRVIVAGCWATSDTKAAEALPGVDLVLTHHDDVQTRLTERLDQWLTTLKPTPALGRPLNQRVGTTSLPLLGSRQAAHQRAYLKIQDGCDAHCTYCIIPKLRPGVWSKPIRDTIEEACRLVAAGHNELVLTGIFLGAYGQATALRRRQADDSADTLARLIDALAADVPQLSRVRLSSLEPGDVTDDLLAALKRSPQVVPHFHLPLQSGSEAILRRMNRQYTRADFLAMADRVHAAFDRPAITTDIITGFPGETDADFADTLDVARRVGFVHTHAFPYSARPGTAAARWTDKAIPAPVAQARIAALTAAARACDLAYRQTFVGQTLPVLIERDDQPNPAFRHGRSDRHFDVRVAAPDARPGDVLRVRISAVTADQTLGATEI